MKYYIHLTTYSLAWAIVFVVAIAFMVESDHFKTPYDLGAILIGGAMLVAIFMDEPKRKKDTFHWYQIHVKFMDPKTGEKRGFNHYRVPLPVKSWITERRRVNKIIGKLAYKDKRIYGTYMEFTVLSYLGEFDA